jgi:hypothetical protein
LGYLSEEIRPFFGANKRRQHKNKFGIIKHYFKHSLENFAIFFYSPLRLMCFKR